MHHILKSQQFPIILFLFIILMTMPIMGCQENANPEPTETQNDIELPSPTEQFEIEDTKAPKQEEDSNPTEPLDEVESEATTKAAPTSQPTPAPTLSDWRDAPISPESISDRVIEIYQNGQQQGRDPHSFSVIGDCQAIPFVFLGPYGRGELEPSESESQLWYAINNFDDSFKRWSVTARGGFTAASILNPLQADPEQCKPGETPLSCEYRLNNPAFVFVTLETWLDPETVDRYEIYLRQIVDAVIAQGSVPILLTKADASELRGKEHIINPVIVNVAYEYQLPLVNFWQSAQYLDNYGIDPDREGFHLSDAGYKLKNTLALRALYKVWKVVEGGEVAAETAPTATPTPEETQPPEIPVTSVNCDSGCIFFGTAQSLDGQVRGAGVFAYQPETKTLTQLLPNGFDLQDVSDDGRQLLVNRSNQLYSIDLSNNSSELISDTFYNLGQQGAYWNNDETEVVYLDLEDPLQGGSGEAFFLIPAADDETRYFESGTCDSKDYCQSEGIFKTADGGESIQLETIAQPVFSPDGSRLAYLNPEAATAENFFHTRYLVLEDTDKGAASRRVLYFPEVSGFMVYADVKTYQFSPDSSQVFILYDVYSEYYEYSLRLETFLWDLETGIRYDLGERQGISASLNPRLVWAPDGESVLLFLTDRSEDGVYTISLYRTDLITGEQLVLLDEEILSGENYTYLTNLYWR